MPALEPLVSSSWLAQNLGHPDLRIVDATGQVTSAFHVTSGRRDGARAHIPGAVFADLLEPADPEEPPFMFEMPSAERFASYMSKLGIGNGTRVVLYDARENMWATRLWWMLRAFGFEDAAVLDGGWTTWRIEQRPTCSMPCSYPPAAFTPRPHPGVVIDRKEEVLDAMHDPSTRVVSGLGHHQGGPTIDCASQQFRSLDELRPRFEPLLQAKRIIAYCGTGIESSSDAFVLHLLGHRNVAVYMGGLFEWCADSSLTSEGAGAAPS